MMTLPWSSLSVPLAIADLTNLIKSTFDIFLGLAVSVWLLLIFKYTGKERKILNLYTWRALSNNRDISCRWINWFNARIFPMAHPVLRHTLSPEE
jgi:hypothetical protein